MTSICQAEVTEAFKKSHDYLLKEKDPALEYVSKLSKNYYNDLLESTKQVFSEIDSPSGLMNLTLDTEVEIRDGKWEGPYHFVVRSAFERSSFFYNLTTYQSAENSKNFSYKYYELNTPVDDPERNLNHNSAEYTTLRRLISNHVFVKNICESTTNLKMLDYGYQFSKIQDLFANEKIEAKINKFLNELEQILNEYQNLGKWTDKLKYNNVKYDHHFIGGFIYRRYLDGGPELINAALDCVKTVRSEILKQPTVTKNAAATKLIEETLKFKTVNFNFKTQLEINSVDIGINEIAKIIYATDYDKAVNYEFDGIGTDYGQPLLTFIQWMSEIDPKYNYRSILQEELKWLDIEGRTLSVGIKSSLLPKSRFSEISFTDEYCENRHCPRGDYSALTIVRELK